MSTPACNTGAVLMVAVLCTQYWSSQVRTRGFDWLLYIM